MHTFSGCSIHVIPVFITHSEDIATKLCYLNRGAKMRPFPECMDLACDWQVGDGEEICRIGDTIDICRIGDKINWMFPVWSRDDMAGIMDGQEVVVTSPAMCSGISNKMVPMLVPDDRSVFDGKSPVLAMRECSVFTKQEYGQHANGGREQPLINIEMAQGIPALKAFELTAHALEVISFPWSIYQSNNQTTT
jgi:hypothetical protein